MRPAHVVEILTPKKVVLNGLWFGPQKPKQLIIWVHGLGSTMFAKLSLYEAILDADTAILAFDNRGHERVARIRKVNAKNSTLGGSAHEVFTDCVDDIQGALSFGKKCGVKNIYLAGHSTGSQKSIYWAHKTKGKDIKGIILLGPLSDYADAFRKPKQYAKGLALAKKLVATKRPHELLPYSLTGEFPADAQRFLSLYTPESTEEIFSYAQPNKNPRILSSVRVPILVLLAEKDEYADRSAFEIGEWFDGYIRAPHSIAVVADTGHSFKGAEKDVARAIRSFMQTQ